MGAQYLVITMAEKRRWIKKTCETCGKEYNCRPDRINISKFCSQKCKRRTEESKEAQSKIMKGRPSNHPMKGKGIQIKCICKNCGKEYFTRPCYFKRGTGFCSVKCRLDYQKGKNNPFFGKSHTDETKQNWIGNRSGEKSGVWKGGISFAPYCGKFNEDLKERVRAFFGYTCQVCGHVWGNGEHKLAVHHVNYDKMVCCNEVIPLFVPVCHLGCHAKTNHNREYWEEIFTNKIMLEHDGECYLPKREL